MTCQTEHGINKFHLRFVAVKRKQEVQSGQTLLGILVLLSCGVCETRNVQNGNCFGLFGTRALRALWILDFVDIGFSHIISGLVEERARESSLQTSIGGRGADGFSDAISGRNIFRTRRMRNSHRGTGSQVCCTPKRVKVKAEMKYCGERGTVSVP